MTATQCVGWPPMEECGEILSRRGIAPPRHHASVPTRRDRAADLFPCSGRRLASCKPTGGGTTEGPPQATTALARTTQGGDSPMASTTERGYGSAHQRERARVKRDLVDKGLAHCWRCGGWIDPGKPWDLGHDDHDRSVYRGPEHRGRECPAGGNRATTGRRSRSVRRWIL